MSNVYISYRTKFCCVVISLKKFTVQTEYILFVSLLPYYYNLI